MRISRPVKSIQHSNLCAQDLIHRSWLYMGKPKSKICVGDALELMPFGHDCLSTGVNSLLGVSSSIIRFDSPTYPQNITLVFYSFHSWRSSTHNLLTVLKHEVWQKCVYIKGPPTGSSLCIIGQLSYFHHFKRNEFLQKLIWKYDEYLL